MATEIAANLDRIHRQIEQACQRCGRSPDSVSLIAVSKKKSSALIQEAADAGQQAFGESYVQEFVDKQAHILRPLDWHFIGALQSNKVKYLRGKTALIHSVDRLSLAEEISHQWQKIQQQARILVQVNVGGEDSKAGSAPEQAVELVRQIARLPHVRIEGLMTLPPYADDPEQVRPWFRQLAQLARNIETVGIAGVSMSTLSMGMSHDFEVAIEEGATLVRVGTAIFGARE
ncbi:MAG: YggS family pyridoxal phosphate-dependent enzyme [Desulfuromonadaceae bacterium]|nr:YggS family pyridoxal phosphate-dependent enzyme [Desulfuromonadaceae bacterium]